MQSRMHTMEEERDLFAGLGWEKEIRRLGYPHVAFNSSPEHDIGAENQYRDDYELISFLQSTQAWTWRMQEEQKRYAKNDKRRADVLEKDATRCINSEANDAADLNEDKLIDTKQEVKVVGKSLRYVSFRRRMK